MSAGGTERIPSTTSGDGGQVATAPAREIHVEPQAPYCLRCFARLAAGTDHCAACGFVSHATLRRKYWNLNPAIRRLELALRLVVPGLSLLAILWLLPTPMLGIAGGWFLFAPVVPIVAMWETAGKLTRSSTHFDGRVFWMIFLPLAGGVMMLGSRLRGPLFWFGIEAVLLTGAVPLLARGYRRWRHRLVTEGAVGSPLPRLRFRPSEDAARGYCLRCFAPVEDVGSLRCERCGFTNHPSLRREYWNLSPRLVRLQRGLVAAIALGGLVVPGLFLVLALLGRLGDTPGEVALAVIGLTIAFLAVYAFLAVPLWMATSKITRRRPSVGVGWLFAGFWIAVAAIVLVAVEFAPLPSRWMLLPAAGLLVSPILAAFAKEIRLRILARPSSR